MVSLTGSESCNPANVAINSNSISLAWGEIVMHFPVRSLLIFAPWQPPDVLIKQETTQTTENITKKSINQKVYTG